MRLAFLKEGYYWLRDSVGTWGVVQVETDGVAPGHFVILAIGTELTMSTKDPYYDQYLPDDPKCWVQITPPEST